MSGGTLFLVVGPSGVGKDTLMAGARAALEDDSRFVFARRVITRPVDAGGEDHIEMSRRAFDRRRAEGGFLLSWSAHGLEYGLPATLAGDLAAGRHVVANVSRSVIAEAAAKMADVRVIAITAPPAMLAGRLAGRGRESEAEIAARLARDGAALPGDVPRTDISNDGSPAEGARRLVTALIEGCVVTC